MRQRVMYIVTWVAATAIATAIGFVATTTVGDVIRGSGPIGAEFRAGSPGTAAAGPPRTAQLTVEGVRLRATCTGRTAQLLEYAPAPGLAVTDVEPGPDEDVDVVLVDRAGRELEIEIYCSAEGEPRPVVRRAAAPAGG